MNQKNSQASKITSLLHTMFKLQQDVDSLLIDQAGVGLSAYRILAALDTKAHLSQRKIAGLLGQTEANISRQIRHMSEDGLVKIAPDKKDKRQHNISCTSKGNRALIKSHQTLAGNSSYILKQLDNK